MSTRNLSVCVYSFKTRLCPSDSHCQSKSLESPSAQKMTLIKAFCTVTSQEAFHPPQRHRHIWGRQQLSIIEREMKTFLQLSSRMYFR